MTDPTPTRADVEAFRPEAIIPSSDTVILPKSQFKRWCENYQASLRAMEARHFAEEAALRERAEAAEEAAKDWAECGTREAIAHLDTMSALTEARAQAAAAWEAGRDAAIEAVRTVALTAFASGCDAHELDEDIRALRRAAPTEGEA